MLVLGHVEVHICIGGTNLVSSCITKSGTDWYCSAHSYTSHEILVVKAKGSESSYVCTAKIAKLQKF